MKLPQDFKTRSAEAEVMDDFYLQGEELRKTLRDLDKVNKRLGGNRITIEGIRKLLPEKTSDKIRIMDVGCGDGAMLREIAGFGKKNQFEFELIGLDANESTVEIGRALSKDYSEISFLDLDVFSEAFKTIKADIILCTLTFHHFKDEQIEYLLNLFLDNSKLGIVINDLERSPISYYLFKAYCAVFINNEIARKDGLISIRRGFRKKDLKKFGEQLKLRHEIHRKWAFRFQWIIYKQ